MGWITDYELFHFQLRKRKSNVLQAGIALCSFGERGLAQKAPIDRDRL